MKILALGGAGAMGAVAVQTAAQLPGIDEIVIADRDLGAAERLARRLAATPVPVRAIQVDVTDDASLRAALTPVDLVLNTVGPYYRFGVAVLRAAIETHTHYLDICDDWEPTLRLLELDEQAREHGVCAVIGMGASPGVSNLLAATAAAELDTVRDAYTAWPFDVDGADGDANEEAILTADGRPTAAAIHLMEQASGFISAVRGGQLTDQRPLSPVELRLPGGLAGTAYTIGHPEPITLLKSLKPRGNSANLIVIRPWTLAYLDALRRDLDNGTLTNETAAIALAKPAMRRALGALPKAIGTRGPGTLPPFFAAVSGKKADRDHIVLARLNTTGPAGDPAATLLGDMARATGIPLALGMSQIVDGSVRQPGVHAPEAIIDPKRFFADLNKTLGRTADSPIYLVEREQID
ncbi:saccharopine dehydrogenase [Nocardia panacis]|uniref:Saccharopine dehydrogenase n=1 Tax=Nocardia panacis TaxID=2340916 RepID=A0A3A4KRC2_9NOCA|nr:saccharopine dehydrogenase NADP-binding domain-containing protein [Nocardia panacis]RJO75610.1 saccharopine dehydrogenase [Nocardia panacis]